MCILVTCLLHRPALPDVHVANGHQWGIPGKQGVLAWYRRRDTWAFTSWSLEITAFKFSVFSQSSLLLDNARQKTQWCSGPQQPGSKHSVVPLSAPGSLGFITIIRKYRLHKAALWYRVSQCSFMQLVLPDGYSVASYRLASTYENLVSVLSDALKNRDWSGTSVRPLLKRTLHQAQTCLLKTFRSIIFQCCLQPVLDNRSVLQSDNIGEASQVHLCQYDWVCCLFNAQGGPGDAHGGLSANYVQHYDGKKVLWEHT